MKHYKRGFFTSVFTFFIISSTVYAQQEMNNSIYQKKYTNSDFYKNGVFQKDIAKKAVREMLIAHGEEFTEKIDSDIWISDFGLGDYEHVGLASVTWFNDSMYHYFVMTMYLLPGQMIPEHIHKPVLTAPAVPAKYESWRVISGWIYNFSEIGEETPNPPDIPVSFGKVISKNFSIVNAGETQSLKKTETYHFMMAGPSGAIVDEYGVYHDRRGWFSSNPKAHPTN
ncbi:hypothetical protein V1389_17090 [Flavobacterium rakeshii]|uniref:hypothetical protein n=1 Tax=Flavobacterium rakeshii TaxID=1038845 RepID=UPI002E7C0C62|nr:hypothetical protein [Flavobacterium rakeshii]MEE1900067.1 hypothetical protein [Flavobacterium rakeshii]